MTTLRVDNCPSCGKVYQKNLRNLCQDCLRAYDQDLRACSDYIRHNRRTNMAELVEKTGVSIAKVTSFIKERRLLISDSPNMGYPCEVCGKPIREHDVCPPCRQRFLSLLHDVKKPESAPQTRETGAGFRIRERLSN